MAHVHVVIIGLAHRSKERPSKRLFTYDDVKGDPDESRHPALTAYLFGAEMVRDRHLVVEERASPICDSPRLQSGTQPIDDGQYIFTDETRRQFLAQEPAAERYLRPYLSGDDWINGSVRSLLYLRDASPTELRAMPAVLERMRAVSAFRSKSKRLSTLAIKDQPTKLNVELAPDRAFLAIPEVSSERRYYVPIGWIEPPAIPSNKLRVILSDDRWFFGILTSAMHMAWMKYIGGRLESRYQYGIGVVYNTFPWPEASDAQRDRIRAFAQGVLDARAAHLGATLADLYDPDAMPPNLRQAHRALDAAVDRLYKRSGFADDRERVEHLFGLYESLIARLPIQGTNRSRKRSRQTKATNRAARGV